MYKHVPVTRTTRVTSIRTVACVAMFCLASIATSATADVAAPATRAAKTIVAPYELESTLGRAVNERTFKGEVQLVVFGYMNCPDVCPTTLADISQSLGLLGSDAHRIKVLFISVDFLRDNPESMRAYVQAFGQNFIGLSGTRAQIDLATRAFGARYRVGRDKRGRVEVAHSGYVYFIDSGGDLVKRLPPYSSPERIAEEISAARERAER